MTHTHNPAKHAAALLAAAALIFCLLVAPAAAFSGAGSGTANNPYIITTPAQLQEMNNAKAAYYQLANDIDLSGVTWKPIGSTSAPFSGQLNGNGKTIKNLVLSSTTQSAGFFSSVTSGTVIKDITFQDCSVTSTSAWCGVVIGSIIMSSSAHKTAVISNVDLVRCSASTSGNYVGCLVGAIYTSAVVEITDCSISYSDAESTSGSFVGCLAGGCDGSSSTEIMRCDILYSHARASGYYVGCLAGMCHSTSSLVIDSSSAQNSIVESVSSGNVGCLVGWCGGASSVNVLNSEAVNCLAKGTSSVGGIFGRAINSGSVITAQMCDVTDCTIVATSNNYAGGIAGRCDSGTTGTFSKCTVTDSTIIAAGYAASICPAFS